MGLAAQAVFSSRFRDWFRRTPRRSNPCHHGADVIYPSASVLGWLERDHADGVGLAVELGRVGRQ